MNCSRYHFSRVLLPMVKFCVRTIASFVLISTDCVNSLFFLLDFYLTFSLKGTKISDTGKIFHDDEISVSLSSRFSTNSTLNLLSVQKHKIKVFG